MMIYFLPTLALLNLTGISILLALYGYLSDKIIKNQEKIITLYEEECAGLNKIIQLKDEIIEILNRKLQ